MKFNKRVFLPTLKDRRSEVRIQNMREEIIGAAKYFFKDRKPGTSSNLSIEQKRARL